MKKLRDKERDQTIIPHPIFIKLKKFLLQNSPEYAYMINGKWGSGKTYFLNKQLESLCRSERDSESKTIKIHYVSANGIKTIDEILSRLFLERVKSNTTAGKVVYGILNMGLKTVNHWTGVDLNAIDPKEFSTYDSEDVIIIDDLERVDKDCDLIGLLGQINSQFVEHQNIKTILVCDESEIEMRFSAGIDENCSAKESTHQKEFERRFRNEKDDKFKWLTKNFLEEFEKRYDNEPIENTRRLIGTFKNYKSAKEKVVSNTLSFEPQIDRVLPKLIQQTSLKEIWNELKTELLLKCCGKNKLQNIRTLKYFILVLEQVFDVIGEAKFDYVFKYVYSSFLPQTIVFREGEYSYNEEIDAVQALINSVEKEKNWFFAKDEELKSITHLIIFNEIKEDQLIKEVDSFINSRKLDDPNYHDFNKLMSPESFKMEDADFLKLVNHVIQRCKEGQYNLTQLAILLSNFDHILEKYGPFATIGSRKHIIDLIEPAITKLKPENEVEYISLQSIEQKLKYVLHNDYDQLKNKMIEVNKKLMNSNDRAYTEKNLAKVMERGLFNENQHDLTKMIRFLPRNDLQPLIDLYVRSNAFKESFNEEVRQWYDTEYYSQLVSYYKYFVDEVEKSAQSFSVPSRSYFNVLKELVKNYEKNYKPN